MLYARSLKDFRDRSQSKFKRILSPFWKWVLSSRFANHLSIVILTAAVVFASSPTIALISPEYYQNNESFASGTIPEEGIVLTEDQLPPESDITTNTSANTTADDDSLDIADNPEILLSHAAYVKPYVPVTLEETGPNPFIKTYVVKGGDTLSVIAGRFQVTTKALQLLNDLSDASINPGRELRIPPPGFEGIAYTLKNDSSIDTVVKVFGVNRDSLIARNEIIDPSKISRGTELLLPGIYPTAVPTTAPTKVPSTAVAKKNTTTTKKTTSKTTVVEDTTPPKKGTGKFSAPVNMSAIVITQSFHGGHPGIDLASKGRKLIPIYASDSGTVSSSSWSSRGYGNCVIINHGNGLYTLYGHLSSIKVSSGQRVSRGQVIGNMGTTGHSTGVHLHFEICTNGCSGYSTSTRINPRKYF